MRQMTWEDWNPYRGMAPRHILVVLAICLFVSLAYELCQWLWGRRFPKRKSGRGQNRGRGFWIGFTLFYVYTVFCATILGRTDGREPEMRTRLFWTLAAALRTGEWVYWYYIVGNILMFIPLGFSLMHLLKDWFREWKGKPGKSGSMQGLLCTTFLCLLLSAVIEGIQYLTGTGLCEADDLLHNALGGGIGGVMYLLVLKK